MSLTAPALFVGHGSPMNAIEDTPSARGWAEITQRFPRPRAIVCVSAHWVTEGVRVTSNIMPRTIHDFGRGFPQALFDQQYPAPGDPELASDIAARLAPFGARLDESWGLDHGTWSVVKHMYPEADVPIVQVSLDARRAPQEHYAIGQALASLRDENVLLIGSGDIVHNLQSFFRNQGKATPWDQEFDDYIIDAVARRDHAAVLNYVTHPAIPAANADWEHFFPIFYTLAAQRAGETPEVFNRHFFPGISMTSIAFGLPQ
ncbi:MAG TPA: 4,5-DOPA dioxygenase extradiol [Terricaulis sp.]|nr:4,5-DOPA dioxygenase extradiol [Terricaulis sp.]HRP10934.1 4,5-DOPA dioxygenase extradiol [Terricaulis sp.]